MNQSSEKYSSLRPWFFWCDRHSDVCSQAPGKQFQIVNQTKETGRKKQNLKLFCQMTAGASAVYSILVQWKAYEEEAVSFYMGVPPGSQQNKIWGSHDHRIFISTPETKSRNCRPDNQPFVVWEQNWGQTGVPS